MQFWTAPLESSTARRSQAWWNHYVINATLALRLGRVQYWAWEQIKVHSNNKRKAQNKESIILNEKNRHFCNEVWETHFISQHFYNNMQNKCFPDIPPGEVSPFDSTTPSLNTGEILLLKYLTYFNSLIQVFKIDLCIVRSFLISTRVGISGLGHGLS